MKLTTIPSTRLNIIVPKNAELKKPALIRSWVVTNKRPLPDLKINENHSNNNDEALAQFFKTFDESSMIEFSNMMLDYMKLSWENEMNCAEKTDEEMELQIFKIKELNKLLLKLKDPAQVIAAA